MSVVGFQDSEARRELIDLEGGLVVPVAALPSLALLKLHAYLDRRQRAVSKDIQDFDWFLRHYEVAGNEVRIHEELGDHLIGDLMDIQDAGAALLGLDLAGSHTEAAIVPARELLVEARDPWSRIITHVLAREPIHDDDENLHRRTGASSRFAAFELGLGLGVRPK
jgi:predicted nucleotidyltransferase